MIPKSKSLNNRPTAVNCDQQSNVTAVRYPIFMKLFVTIHMS